MLATRTRAHTLLKNFIAMTDVPFKRPRIHEGAAGSLMSCSTAGESIHYRLIYPRELFCVGKQLYGSKARQRIQTYLPCGRELCLT